MHLPKAAFLYFIKKGSSKVFQNTFEHSKVKIFAQKISFGEIADDKIDGKYSATLLGNWQEIPIKKVETEKTFM